MGTPRKISDRTRMPQNTVGETRTKQSMKDATDINNILEKYKRTGVLTHVNRVKAEMGDFSQVMTFHEALNAVKEAQEAFDGLPAQLRAQFQNDPQQLLNFLDNPDNRDKAVEMGLIEGRLPHQEIENPVEPTPPKAKEPEQAPAKN